MEKAGSHVAAKYVGKLLNQAAQTSTTIISDLMLPRYTGAAFGDSKQTDNENSSA